MVKNKHKESASERVRVYPSTYRRLKILTAKKGKGFILADVIEEAINGKDR